MKIALLADIHWGHKSFSKRIFLKDLSYFENVVFPYFLENKITHVIFCGDLIHNRDLSSNYILQELKQRFFGWFEKNNIEFHVLIGNHDSLYKNKIDYNFPRTNLKEFEYITVYDEQKIVHINGYRFGFQPWIPQDNNIELISPEKIDILVGHFDINNALMQGNSRSISGRNINSFKDYKQVISGHYHATSDYNNVKYIGAPYQMSYRDYNNKKGFWVLDNDYNFEYIENTYSPKYLKLFYAEKDDGDIVFLIGGLNDEHREVSLDEAKELISKNYFKFIVKQYKNQKILQDVFIKLTQNSYDRVDIINEVSSIKDFDFKAFEDEIGDEDMELIDIIVGYVEKTSFTGDRINKKKINRMLNEYYKKTKLGDDE